MSRSLPSESEGGKKNKEFKMKKKFVVAMALVAMATAAPQAAGHKPIPGAVKVHKVAIGQPCKPSKRSFESARKRGFTSYSAKWELREKDGHKVPACHARWYMD
jgi:hypothetical protein